MTYAELAGVLDGSLSADVLAVDESGGNEQGCVRGPERALMSALLFDGVIACMNYAGARGKSSRSKFNEAFSWIKTRNDEYIFSFDNVCQCLGLDPNFLRKGVIQNCAHRDEQSKKSRRTF